MAHSEALPLATIQALAVQVGKRLASIPAVESAAEATVLAPLLGESFSVWQLAPDAVSRSTEDLQTLATPTERWHHQIRLAGRAQAFARSVASGPQATERTVTQLYESRLAARLDAAIDWVDAHTPGDPVVRLLVAPTYQLNAFWLLDGMQSHIVVIDMPKGFTHLHYQTLYSTADFLARLAQEASLRAFPSCE